MSDPIIDRTMAVRIATQLGWEPKREWVGLTNDERAQIYIELKSVAGFYSVEKYAFAIEAKLKEKNT